MISSIVPNPIHIEDKKDHRRRFPQRPTIRIIGYMVILPIVLKSSYKCIICTIFLTKSLVINPTTESLRYNQSSKKGKVM